MKRIFILLFIIFSVLDSFGFRGNRGASSNFGCGLGAGRGFNHGPTSFNNSGFNLGASIGLSAGLSLVNMNRRAHGQSTIPLRFGTTINGQGNVTNFQTSFGLNSSGDQFYTITYEFDLETQMRLSREQQRAIEAEKERQRKIEAENLIKKSFMVEDNSLWKFSQKNVDGRVYNRAEKKNKTEDTMVLPSGLVLDFKSTISKGECLAKGISRFDLKTEDEKVASGSFIIESTSLLWRFERKWIDGCEFHRAYVPNIPKFDMITKADGGEWWIPAGQYKVDPNKRNKSSFAKDLGIPEEMFNKPSPEFEERKRSLIGHNIDYNPYIDVASRFVCNLMYTAGYFAADMFIPGGVDNLRKYLSHEISSAEYAKRVAVDIAVTVEATAAGAIIGGMNGGAGGLALAGVGAVPGSIAGAVTGATTGFVGSRITVATARTAEKSGSSSSKGGPGFEKEPKEPKLREVKIEKPKARVASTKIDLDKYVDGFLGNKGALLNRGKTLDGHQYYEVMKKTEYMGETFKKGDYISLDTLHFEVEWFRGPKTHKGAVDVLTGKLKENSARENRVLKIK